MGEAVIVLVNTNEPELAPWQGARMLEREAHGRRGKLLTWKINVQGIQDDTRVRPSQMAQNTV